MGRTEERKKQKQAKKKLTTEQFNMCRAELIDSEVDKRVSKILKVISKHMVDALKQNRIGEERRKKIVDDFTRLCKEGHKKVEEEENA